MMAIELDHYVEQGTYAVMTPAAGKAFGTTGLQCCVGVIAELQDKSFFCGHMDHAVKAGIDFKAFKTKVKSDIDELLKKIGDQDQIVGIYFVTEPTMVESKWTVEAIEKKYGARCTGKQVDAQHKGLYVKDNEVSFIKNTDEVTMTTKQAAYTGAWRVQ
jgi:hypothetical protein